MACFYSDEDFPLKAVLHLRSLGHHVLTIQESGLANQGTPDSEVLKERGRNNFPISSTLFSRDPQGTPVGERFVRRKALPYGSPLRESPAGRGYSSSRG